MTQEELEKRLKVVKGIAKGDAKRYIQQEIVREGHPSVGDYYGQCVDNIHKPERLKKSFGYTDEQIGIMLEAYNEAFWSAHKWWQGKMAQADGVLAKYKPVFDEAEEYAKAIDVSDIKDGFPCGWATLYLQAEARKTDLGKALRVKYTGDSYSAKVCPWSAYGIPVNFPTYGQCISFSERICEKVSEFLASKDIPTSVHTYID